MPAPSESPLRDPALPDPVLLNSPLLNLAAHRDLRRIRRRMRNAAMRGALVASVVLIVVIVVRGQGDAWLIAGILAAVATSVLVEAALSGRHQADPEARLVTPARRGGIAEALLSKIPDPVILVDGRVTVVEANAAARALLPGLKAGQPLSFGLRSPDVLGAIDAVLADHAPARVEYTERIPTERAFEVHANPLGPDAEGLGLRSGVVLFFRDLTSARKLEHMRVDFVANASHELRTPLASLLGFIETLQGSARDDPRARERFLEVMRTQAQRMSRLVDDLLSLSRIEMRVHQPPTAIIDLAGVVAPMIETLTPLAREKGVAIEAAIGPGPFHVRGDRDELLRVVENLIENAVKYGESGGRVAVTLEHLEPKGLEGKDPEGKGPEGKGPAGARIALSVRDHGPGIAPEHLPRLTERFYRADATASRQKGGTGLGLAIVKHIVNRHRGELAIESEPGQGALFKVVLSAAKAP
jgi:two-component system phosphate regulon sensor histidine kinase PhoR